MEVNEVFTQAFENPNIPKIYLNGFTVGTSNADLAVIGQRNGQPAVVLNMSFELAKTLVDKIGNVVKQLEEAAEVNFLTTVDVDNAAGKQSGKLKS